MKFFSDKFEIDSQREVTKEGYLLARNCKLARTGILQYQQAEIGDIDEMPENRRGTVIRVHRAASPLLDEATLSSFKSKPITVLHPNQLVSAESAKEDMVGITRDNLRSDGTFILGDLLIMDKDAIKLIGEGTKELSLGYSADIIWQPGTSADGETYDAVMNNYSGNHVAIVPKGRCGSECKIADSDIKLTNEGTKDMEKIILDGVEHEVSEAVATHIKDMELKQEKQEAKDAEAETKLQDMKNKKAELEGKLDAVNEELEEAKKKKVGDADIPALVSARVELESKAKKIVGDSADFNGKTDREVRAEAIKSRNGFIVTDEHVDGYVNGRFDMICEDITKSETVVKDAAVSGLSHFEKKRQELLKTQNEGK